MGGIYGTEVLTLPIAWLSALATTDVRLWVYSMRGLYGIMRALHLLGMGTFIGMVVILDLRGLGLFPPAALDGARPRLGRVLNISFWVTVTTGVLLFLRDPIGVGLHTMFLPKLILVTAGYLFARGLRPKLRGARLKQGSAVVSLGIWLTVVGASTWNHVERPTRVTESLRLHTLGQ